MAIQVGGTTVVDNSRNLTNIGNATLSGNIVVTGNVTGSYILGNVSNLTGLPSTGTSTSKAYFLSSF